MDQSVQALVKYTKTTSSKGRVSYGSVSTSSGSIYKDNILQSHGPWISKQAYTDKIERTNFLICKEIQKEAVAKSYMTNSLLMHD
jgi:hypothetical protein